MSYSGYSTIIQYSSLRAVGPFLFTAQNLLSGNNAVINPSSIQITWSTGVVGFKTELPPIQTTKKQPAWEINHYEELMNTAFATMLASEAVLSKDWDSPEEDEAWADL